MQLAHSPLTLSSSTFRIPTTDSWTPPNEDYLRNCVSLAPRKPTFLRFQKGGLCWRDGTRSSCSGNASFLVQSEIPTWQICSERRAPPRPGESSSVTTILPFAKLCWYVASCSSIMDIGWILLRAPTASIQAEPPLDCTSCAKVERLFNKLSMV